MQTFTRGSCVSKAWKAPPRDPFEYILNLEANLHSLLSFPWTLAPQIICDKILFSHTRRWYEFLFLYFFLFLFILFIYFRENYCYFFMFRDVPERSGMFRNVPCSGFYRRPKEIGGCNLSEKVVLISGRNIPNRNSFSISSKPFRPSWSFSGKWNWFVQMVDAISGAKFTSPELCVPFA